MIPYIIIDITSPPTNTFNLYMALLQSLRCSTIWLLGDFDEDMFKRVHDMFLMEEDDRLEKLDSITETWWTKMNTEKRISTMSLDD